MLKQWVGPRTIFLEGGAGSHFFFFLLLEGISPRHIPGGRNRFFYHIPVVIRRSFCDIFWGGFRFSYYITRRYVFPAIFMERRRGSSSKFHELKLETSAIFLERKTDTYIIFLVREVVSPTIQRFCYRISLVEGMYQYHSLWEKDRFTYHILGEDFKLVSPPIIHKGFCCPTIFQEWVISYAASFLEVNINFFITILEVGLAPVPYPRNRGLFPLLYSRRGGFLHTLQVSRTSYYTPRMVGHTIHNIPGVNPATIF